MPPEAIYIICKILVSCCVGDITAEVRNNILIYVIDVNSIRSSYDISGY